MRILVLCDDLWHPGEVVRRGLALLEDRGFDFDVVMDAKDILTPGMIREYPVILCCKSNRLSAANPAPWFEEGVTEVGPAELEEYVRNGGGFLSLHAGNTSAEGEAYTDFVGNFFRGHPPRCEMEVVPVAEHPVVAGVDPFSVRDEHYNIQVVARDAEIFLETRSPDGGTQVGGYGRQIGAGRLCALTPGHILEVWRHRGFRRLVENALRWCAGTDSPPIQAGTGE